MEICGDGFVIMNDTLEEEFDHFRNDLICCHSY